METSTGEINIEGLDLVCDILDEFNFSLEKFKVSKILEERNVLDKIQQIKNKIKSCEENLLKLTSRNTFKEDVKLKSSNSVNIKLTEVKQCNIVNNNFITPGGPLKRKLFSSQNKNEISNRNINSSLDDEILNDKYYQPCSKIKETENYILLHVKSREKGDDFLMKLFKPESSLHFKNEVSTLEVLNECRYTLNIINRGKLNNKYEFIIFEYRKLIEINYNECKSEIEVFFYVLQIFYGLCELHYNGIIHNSLKLEDIMLDELTGQIYIFNFPNSVKPEPYDLSVSNLLRQDVFSLGSIILKFILNPSITGELFYNEYKFNNILNLLHSNNYKLVPTNKLETMLLKIFNLEQYNELKLIDIQEEEWIKDNKQLIKKMKADSLKLLQNIIT